MAVHLFQPLSREPASGVAYVDEPILVEVAEKDGANMLAAVTRLGVPTDHELLPELDLQLEPVTRANSGLVMRVYALCDDAFPALTSRLLQHLLAITLDGFSQTELRSDALSDALH